MTTDTAVTFIEMRIAKVVGVRDAGEDAHYIVLDEVRGDRHLVVEVGPSEGLSLAAILGGTDWPRPMTYQFTAALVQSLGGQVRQVRIDRLVSGAYAATVEVEGPLGVGLVDARSSDALNLAALADAAIFVAPEVTEDCQRWQTGDSSEATWLRRAPDLPPMTIRREDAAPPAV